MNVAGGRTLKSRFLQRPVPDAVFELASEYVSGIRVSRRRRSVQARVILPVDRGTYVSSFDRPNIADGVSLGERVEEMKERLRLSSGMVALLIPEPCLRVLVLAVDAIPEAQAERDSFVRWRVAKQMPVLPDDLRLDYAVSSGTQPRKVVAALAREAVVREYEAAFETAGLNVGAVTVPSLSLFNVADGPAGGSSLLLNIEEDHLSLLAVMDGDCVLYRQKNISPAATSDGNIGQVITEVENTLHFLEDKEKKKMERIWIRLGALNEAPEILPRLKAALTLPLRTIDEAVDEDWGVREKALLAPLLGQLP